MCLFHAGCARFQSPYPMERNAGGQVLSPKNTATTVGHAGPLAGAGRATQLLDPLRHHSSAAESIFRPQAPSGPSENDVQPGLPSEQRVQHCQPSPGISRGIAHA